MNSTLRMMAILATATALSHGCARTETTSQNAWDTWADTWTATDSLGRSLETSRCELP